MVDPLDEGALDFLEPEPRKVVREMLAAVVEHPRTYSNGFTIRRSREGGYEYFLGNNGGDGPFINNRRLEVNVRGPLLHHGVAGPKVNPQWPQDFISFTEPALEWHRNHGGPNADEIRRLVARHLRQQELERGFIPAVQAEAVAAALGLPTNKVGQQVQTLLALGFLRVEQNGTGMGFGVLSFTPDGLLWAETGYRPIAEQAFQRVAVQIELSLSVQIEAIISQAQASRVPPDVVQELREQLEAVRLELAKPRGQGRYEPVKDLINTASNSATLLSIVLPFLNEHRDKIQSLADALDRFIP